MKNMIYKLRTSAGMSQEGFADAFGVSRQSVQKWESGECTPGLPKLIEISKFFGISLDELVMNKAPEPAPAPQTAKSELYTDIKEKVLTDKNRKKAKKGLKIGAIALGIFLAIDLISFVIYVALNGFPK